MADTYFSRGWSLHSHRCTCGETYAACPVRVGIAGRMRDSGFPDFEWEALKAVPVPGFLQGTPRRENVAVSGRWAAVWRRVPDGLKNRLLERYIAENAGLVQSIGAETGCEWYLDGSKTILRFELLKDAFERFRLIHLVRHPAAYLVHWQRTKPERLDFMLDNWDRYHRRARALAASLDQDQCLVIRYEDMCGRPRETVRRVLDFLDLPADASPNPDALELRPLHLVGNRMLRDFVSVEERPLEWRSVLPARHVERVDALIAQRPWLTQLYSSKDAPGLGMQ
jgi:hypothetical protein